MSGNNIFAGTMGPGIFFSSNNGKSWIAVNSGLPANRYVMSLAMSGSNIFVGTWQNGVFLSTNSGISWTTVNSGLPDLYIMSLAVSRSDIFVGTWKNGVFLSTNNGTDWNAVNSGLVITNSIYGPIYDVRSLAVSDSNIFAGTWINGVWRRPLSELVGVINPKPQRGVLNFNIHSPSHTNPNVTINFSIPHSNKVTIKIFNLNGKEIATLVNGNLEPGTHSLTWNTRNLATGCYLVKMQAGSNSFVKSIPIFK